MAVLAAFGALVPYAAVQAAPVAQQYTEQVYGLPGRLAPAQDEPFANYLIVNDGTLYGIAGQSPAIEQQIAQFTAMGRDTVVKVWGTLYGAGLLASTPQIIASAVELVSAPTPAPTPVPAAPSIVVAQPVVNVRNGPGLEYPIVGQLLADAVCAAIGRTADLQWWLVRCPNGVEGWVSSAVVLTSGDANSLPVMTVAPPATPTPAPPPAGFTTWRASFYPNRDLTGEPALIAEYADLNFNWGTGSPGGSVPADNFSARFERLYNLETGNYTFVTQSDDGVRVWVDNDLVIDDWREGSERQNSAARTLSGSHALRVEYFEAGGQADLGFDMALQRSTDDWDTAYFNNTNLDGVPSVQRYEPRSQYPLDRQWGTGSPVPGAVAEDNWSARWRGRFYFEPGDYVFAAQSDDGVRVYLDGLRVVDAWSDGYKEVANRFLGVGTGDHEIVVEFYERGGAASVRVWWYKDNSTSPAGGGGQSTGGSQHRDE
jgi:uncharacterized protein YgiM (DUF1202 family)